MDDGLDGVTDWLTEQTLADVEVGPLLQGVCERLWAAGLPVWRSYVGLPTLHPLYMATTHVWKRGEPVDSRSHEHAVAMQAQYANSPVRHVVANRLDFFRRRLEGEHARIDFPVLAEIRDQGGTDYALFRVPFVGTAPGPGPDGLLASFSTDAPGGFSDADLRALRRVLRALAVASKMAISRGITRNVLAAYLGRDAGERVLRGSIKRGDCEAIHAAIWYSDLRDSTPLAARLSPEAFLGALNCYFEATAGAVVAQGGEVLRFVGDAVLAIFPTGNGEAEACRRAVDAVRDAERRMEATNQTRGGEPLAYGVGLHLGEVLFGNIGIPDRVEFSVTGPAANEAARLEGLTKALGATAVFSEDFARRVDLPWRSLGRHALRGAGRDLEVFTLPA